MKTVNREPSTRNRASDRTNSRPRRPRLTRKRIAGLQVLAELADELVLVPLPASDKRTMKTAMRWIRDMRSFDEQRAGEKAEADQ